MNCGLSLMLGREIYIDHLDQSHTSPKFYKNIIMRINFILKFYFSGLISETKQNFVTPSDVKAKQSHICPIDTPFVLSGI